MRSEEIRGGGSAFGGGACVALPAQLRGLEHAALGLLQGVKGHAGGAVGAEQQAAVRLPELCGRTGNDKLSDSFNAPPHPPASPHHFLFLTRCPVVGQAKGHLLGVQRRSSTGLWGERKKGQLPVTTEGSHHYAQLACSQRRRL